MLSAIPDLSAQEKTNSGALCKRDRNNNKTTVVVVVAISHYSIYIPLFGDESTSIILFFDCALLFSDRIQTKAQAKAKLFSKFLKN